MAFKKVDALPPRTRIGGGGSSIVTAEDEKGLKDNPGEWFLAAEDVLSAQSYTAWAKRQNKDDEGPFYVTTRAHKDAKGNPHIETAKIQTGENKGKDTVKRYVDVYMTYSPEGKPSM